VSATAFPLCWPERFPRSRSREAGKFKATLSGALNNVEESLRMFASDSGKKLEALVISSNVTLGAQRPEDPGVAVWFTWDGMQVCIPVDRYSTLEANLQAIHHIIEARRVELRHGTLSLVRASMTGFLSLPAPADAPAKRTWRQVMNFTSEPVSLDLLEQRYRLLASKRHPDKPGGSDQAFVELNAARVEALQELGNGH
jgi:hypothetical protein